MIRAHEAVSGPSGSVPIDQILAMYCAGERVCDIDLARKPIKVGRVNAYQLAATGALAEGIPVLKCGRNYKVPIAPLLRALGIAVPGEGAVSAVDIDTMGRAHG